VSWPGLAALQRGNAGWSDVVTPAWRSPEVGTLPVGVVIDSARDEGCARVGLWVLADDARARRFHQCQGSGRRGTAGPFPGDAEHSISELILDML
jgi:hypothetical protein